MKQKSIAKSRALPYVALTACLALGVIAAPAQGQGRSALLGFTARFGWAPTDGIDQALGAGLELEALPGRRLVPSARLDSWSFGISCVTSGCPSGVTTVSLGLKYRVAGETSVTPYAGGDIGYMSWTSDVTGLSLRLRAGLDIGVIPHVAMNLDVGSTHYRGLWRTERRMLQNHLLGFSAGLKIW